VRVGVMDVWEIRINGEEGPPKENSDSERTGS